ncbi:hypothetical protein L3V82_13220, partial [Thiotrichales bacterium 19S3-7]|nr:hypothetical protein [Thiotrichales bacterium 19S3-7]MCF6803128.1 hypothetical protein [Thiotrichales bacterium 19S3-11]
MTLTLNIEKLDISDELINNDLLEILKQAPKLQPTLDKFYEIQKQQFKSNQPNHRKANSDANVAFDKDQIFKATKIFSSPHKDPDYAEYRLTASPILEISDQPVNPDLAFTIKPSTDLKLVDVMLSTHESLKDFKQTYMLSFKSKVGKSLYLGRQQLNLTDEFIPIASLSTHEKITDIFIHNANYKGIEIKYSEADNLYYVRSKDKPKSIQFNFLLKKDPQPEITDQLPSDVKAYLKHLRSFKSGPEGRVLRMIKEEPGYIFGSLWTYKTAINQPTGRDYIELMNAQKLGACRHRAILFKDFMDQKHPEIPTRIIHNNVHAYVEVQYLDQWVKLDLGGYQAAVEADQTLFTDDPFKESVGHPELIDQSPVIPERLPKRQPDTTYKKASAYFASKSVTDKSIDTLKLIQAVISDEKNKTHLIELDHSA